MVDHSTKVNIRSSGHSFFSSLLLLGLVIASRYSPVAARCSTLCRGVHVLPDVAF